MTFAPRDGFLFAGSPAGWARRFIADAEYSGKAIWRRVESGGLEGACFAAKILVELTIYVSAQALGSTMPEFHGRTAPEERLPEHKTMTNSAPIPRSFLVYAVCLPVAIVLGYQLAEPLESTSMAIVVLVLSVLSIPLLMRWHHGLLLAGWNSALVLYFLPGTLPLYVPLAAISCIFAVLGRAMGRNIDFFAARSVALSLLALALVVAATAALTGGVGIKALGSATFGGKKYVFVFASIAGYFALASQPMSPGLAGPKSSLFFLSGLCGLLGVVGTFVPGLGFFGDLFSTPYHLTGLSLDDVYEPIGVIMRPGWLIPVSAALFCYLLKRYGVAGVLEIRRPWRFVMLVAATAAAMESGFRSVFGMFLLTFAVVFYWEGLFRTRYVWVLLGALAITASIVVPMARDLPLSMQRTLSFLPIDVDPFARMDAEGSTTWRVEIWKELLPQVPKYLLVGKGYGIDPDELYQVSMSAMQRPGTDVNPALVTEDYHSGIFSVLIPFGLVGLVAFLWFLCASVKVLHRNYLFGEPALETTNRFLLSYFIAQALFFFLVFGSLYSGLCYFTGLVGLSVSLNGGVCKPRAAEGEEGRDDTLAEPEPRWITAGQWRG
jgi:hypothetical protein